ncbi:metallophosphoesterase [Bacillus alkalicellulosilyticus]|uniref:metallophosphoesterase n=1 Tax=Alkalihalobacterium alkalicellulosilyticum TaxID=1912214 RepID=UPI000996EE27|nr:metallophosphoesterase [Bacillus alkalicellulosilyticus]
MWWIGLVISGISLLLYMYIEAHRNRVIESKVELDGFPSGFSGIKLFFISDVHARVISNKILKKIKGKADIVIIGGDLIEKGVPLQRAEENLKKLRDSAPTYFVWGNNDYAGEFRQLDVLLLENRITVLDNTAIPFEQGTDTFYLIGVDDLSFNRSNLDLAVQDCNEGYRVLVSHNPDIIEMIKPEHQIGLLLSGHTHGGQIRIFGWGLRKKGGWEQVRKTTVLISNGYGTKSIPFRLGAPAQAHLITLHSK